MFEKRGQWHCCSVRAPINYNKKKTSVGLTVVSVTVRSYFIPACPMTITGWRLSGTEGLFFIKPCNNFTIFINVRNNNFNTLQVVIKIEIIKVPFKVI